MTVNRGSEWLRWEPHIHAPGTVLNNQFGGRDAWTNYLDALENATPKIEAIGVTDYYVTDTYEEVLRRRIGGRLPDVQLIFPNIELRLDVAARSGFVNLHLLVVRKIRVISSRSGASLRAFNSMRTATALTVLAGS